MALTPVLSGQQTQRYCEDNYLLVSWVNPGRYRGTGGSSNVAMDGASTQ